MWNKFFVLHVENEPDDVAVLKAASIEVLGEYGIPAADVVWDIVASRDEALNRLLQATRDRGSRGYDATFVDLEIFGGPGNKSVNEEYGIEVIKEASKCEWVGPIICVTNYAERDTTLTKKKQSLENVHLDEWLYKGLFQKEAASLLRAKLRRLLIPVELVAFQMQRPEPPDPPLIFTSSRMKELLRDLVFLARRPYASWPLARILLLGEPGSGKGALSQAFHRLLPNSERAPLVRLNCASAVSEGHGGRISLFGACGFGNQVADQAGVFERATYYAKRTEAGLAEKNQAPLAEKAGVVFLDEFAELAPSLQASILNAIEDGEVRREGNGSTVRIRCHVVLATNVPAELLGSKVRPDLIDRIPNILEVPSLLQRSAEIPALIEGLAAANLSKFEKGPHRVTITKAGIQLIDRAIREDWIRGVRQIQAIADVLPGETRITDANLRGLFARVNILSDDELRDVDEASVADYARQARDLKLPPQLQTSELPAPTAWCVQRLYETFVDPQGKPISLDELNGKEPEVRKRFALIIENCVLHLRIKKRLFSESMRKTGALRKFCERQFDGNPALERPKLNPSDLEKEARRNYIVGILLSPP